MNSARHIHNTKKVSGHVRRRISPHITLREAGRILKLSPGHLHQVIRGKRDYPATLARWNALIAQREAAATNFTPRNKSTSTSKK